MPDSVRPLFLKFLSILFVVISTSPLLFAQSAPDLGSAADFGVFTGVGEVDNTGLSVIEGNVGTNAGAVTGFPPGVFTGSMEIENAVTLAATGDLTTGWNELELTACDVVLGVTMGNGQILTSQVYCAGGASTITGELILDAQGDPNAVFIIKIDGALDVADMSTITLINLAQASNVYWQVNGAVSILDNSIFKGTIVANGAIHLYTNTVLEGRALSVVGAITLASTSVILPVSGFPGSLVVVTPAAGDTLIAGTENYQIEFIGVNVTLAKRLEVSYDAGATWSDIDQIRNDSSSYSWNVPMMLTTEGLIRITDSNGVSGTSGMFVIDTVPAPASLSVVTPAEGDTLVGGTQNYQIEFVGVNVTMQKTIEFSIDSGATWMPVAVISNDSSSYSWNVPDMPTTQGLIRITDSNGVSGTSGLFVITMAPGTLTVVRPAAGENIICATQDYAIQFTGTNLTLWKMFEYSLDGGTTWTLIGTDSSTATTYPWDVPSVTSTQALVRITDSNGVSGTSGLFSITRSPAPVITMQPVAPLACVGGSATFMATATGGGLAWQWRRNGMPIPGAVESTYTIGNVTEQDQGTYDVVVTSFCSLPTTSTPVFVAVNTVPVLYKWTEAQTVAPGRPVSFSIIATGTNLRYQWWKGRTPIAGATSSTYTLPSVAIGNAGAYSVEVSNPCTVTSLTSGGMFLFIDDGNTETPNLADQTVCVDQPVRFVAPGSPMQNTYQWRRNGVDIVGATSPALQIDNVQEADQALYTAKITDRESGVSMVTTPARLTVDEAAVITSQPSDVEVCSNEVVLLSATAKGSGLSYQWRKDGVEIAGATGSDFEISTALASDAGSYDIVIGGNCGEPIISSSAVVSILAPATISQQPVGRSAAPGENVAFTVASDGSSYQWRKDGVDIAGATTATLSLVSVRTEDAGRYDVVIGSPCGPSLISEAATLTVQAVSAVAGSSSIAEGMVMTVMPHPAYGATRIRISLPNGIAADAGTLLGLYDQHGRQVLDLSASFVSSGYEGVEFDASSLAAGLYHCRLVTKTWSGSLGSIVVQK